MKDEDRILLMFGWALLMIAIIALICRVTYKMDVISKKVDSIEITAPEVMATKTDATITDSTPSEPGDEEIVIEIRDEYKEKVQTAPEEIATPNEPDLEEAEEQPEQAYMGCYELTAYIETGNPCADGVYPEVGYTVACNDSRLWHKWIYIEGYGDYYVHDTGGMANNVIDIFVASYDEAIQFGRRAANVYVKE